MDPQSLETFVGGLARCLGEPTFLDRFYARFVEASPEVDEKFRDTDFARQKIALRQSLYLMVMATDGGEAAVAYIERIAKRHGRRDLDIRPELYDLWLDALIATAREHDPDFDGEAEALWRRCLSPGIEVMRSLY